MLRAVIFGAYDVDALLRLIQLAVQERQAEGAPIVTEAAKSAMRRAWKAAGITKARPWKSLRATFASRKAEAGVPVPIIAELMGLTTTHVLEHYVKPSGAHLAEAMGDRHGQAVRFREA